jgi:hypothetical protein
MATTAKPLKRMLMDINVVFASSTKRLMNFPSMTYKKKPGGCG